MVAWLCPKFLPVELDLVPQIKPLIDFESWYFHSTSCLWKTAREKLANCPYLTLVARRASVSSPDWFEDMLLFVRLGLPSFLRGMIGD